MHAMRRVMTGMGLCACLILLLAPLTLHAGQAVRVLVETDEEGRVSRAQALDSALELGVFQEAEALLHGKLDHSRLIPLRELLTGKASEYVLGYSETDFDPTEWGGVLYVDVRVNRQALRAFLQSMGVYYTLDQQIGYVLESDYLAPDDEAVIRDLELVSGLIRHAADSPILRLARTSEGAWQGLLDYEGLIWSDRAADLPGLWAGLWNNFFSLDRVRHGFEDRLVLTTQGWRGAVDVWGFDQVLRSWELEAGNVVMAGMSLFPQGVKAQWEITTMDRARLEDRLGRTLGAMNINFSVR